jgi:hypothetical protein
LANRKSKKFGQNIEVVRWKHKLNKLSKSLKKKLNQKKKMLKKPKLKKVKKKVFHTKDGAFEIFTQTLTGSKIQSYISKQDSNIELKQLLIECVETCYITSYELSIKGKPIEEYGEIANYPEIQSKSVLKMKFGFLLKYF